MSYLFSTSLHYLQRYGVDLVVKPGVLLQTIFKVHQQCSEVCPSQIQGEVLSTLWKTKQKMSLLIICFYTIQFNLFMDTLCVFNFSV